MLLSMQDVYNTEGVRITRGLKPEDLEGLQADTERDGKKILNKIETFLTERRIPREKTEVMIESFKCIASNIQRDIPVKLDSEVSKILQ
jgi:restriction enzyme bgcI alpha subunit